jgi:PBSX family phage terminase large subunit
MDKSFLKRVVNPIFWHLNEAIRDPSVFIIILSGGRGSSKSYSVAQTLPLQLMAGKDVLSFRSVGKDVQTTFGKQVLKTSRIFSKIDPNIITPAGVPKTPPLIITHKKNSLIVNGSDNSDDKRLKGLEKISIIYLDEADSFNFAFIEQIQMSLRGMANQKFIISFNPVDVNHPLKTKLIDNYEFEDIPKYIKTQNDTIRMLSTLSENSFVKKSTCGRVVYTRTVYKDNFWIAGHPLGDQYGYRDQAYIDRLEGLKTTNPNLYRVNTLGEWGVQEEGLVFKHLPSFQHLEVLAANDELENKIYWTTYANIPDIEFYTVFGLDFGGGGGNNSDEPDGSSKDVLVELNINKTLKYVYVKLHLYCAHASSELMTDKLDQTAGKSNEILADNARGDRITDLQNLGYIVIPAKTAEGGSSQIVSGYDIMKNYKWFIYENDHAIITELNNHRWAVSPSTGLTNGKPEDKYKDVPDAMRYPIVYYHRNYNF